MAALRAELQLLRRDMKDEAACSALLDRLRGIALAKQAIFRQRIESATAAWAQAGDGEDDNDHDHEGGSSAMGGAAYGSRRAGGAVSVDHFIGARHAVQTRQARRRRGHNTLSHALEQAKLGYGGVMLRARNAVALNISAEALALERVRLDEAKRQRDVLRQLLDARLAAKAARDADARRLGGRYGNVAELEYDDSL